MSLLLSIPITPAYWPVVPSLILCVIFSRLKRINTLSGVCMLGGGWVRYVCFRGGGDISFKTLKKMSTLQGKNLLPFL